MLIFLFGRLAHSSHYPSRGAGGTGAAGAAAPVDAGAARGQPSALSEKLVLEKF